MAMVGANRTRSGKYNPLFPDKCINMSRFGKPPTFRSSWEATCFRSLDTNTNVIRWGSELPDTKVDYIKPTDGMLHQYFPDLYVEIRNRSGVVDKWVIEVKPCDECAPPNPPKRKTEKAMHNYVLRQHTWLTNEAKWKAAKLKFARIGVRFMVATEETIYKRLQ